MDGYATGEHTGSKKHAWPEFSESGLPKPQAVSSENRMAIGLAANSSTGTIR